MAEQIIFEVKTTDKTQFKAIADKLKGLDVEVTKTNTGFGGFNALLKSTPVLALAAGAGIGVIAGGIGRFAASSLAAAGNYNNLMGGLIATEGNLSKAKVRFDELNEAAKFPALERDTLIRYNGILQNAGLTAVQVDTVYQGLSKSLSTFGGNAEDVKGILLQYSQAAQKGKIEMQDFKGIVERSQGTFLKTAGEVKGFKGGLDALKTSFEDSGESFNTFFHPIFEKLGTDFPGAKVEGYTNLVGNLEDAFGNLQAAVGQKLTGGFTNFGLELLDTIEAVTDLINGTDDLATSTQNFIDTLNDLDAGEGDIDLVSTQIDILNIRADELKEKFPAIRESWETMGGAAGDAARELKGVNERLAILKGVTADSAATIDTLNTSNGELEGKIKDVNVVIAENQAKLEALPKITRHNADEHNALKDIIADEITKRVEYEEKIVANNKLLDLSKGHIIDVSAEKDKLKGKIDEVITSTERYSTATKGLIPQLEGMPPPIVTIVTNLVNLDTSLTDVVGSLVDTKKEMDALHSFNNVFGDSLREDISVPSEEVSGELIELESNLKNLKSPMEKIVEDANNLKIEAKNAADGLTDLNSRFIALRKHADENALDHIQTSMSDFTDTVVDDALPALEDMDEAFDAVGSAVPDADAKLGLFDESLGDLRESIGGLVADLILGETSLSAALQQVGKNFLDSAITEGVNALTGGGLNAAKGLLSGGGGSEEGAGSGVSVDDVGAVAGGAKKAGGALKTTATVAGTAGTGAALGTVAAVASGLAMIGLVGYGAYQHLTNDDAAIKAAELEGGVLHYNSSSGAGGRGQMKTITIPRVARITNDESLSDADKAAQIQGIIQLLEGQPTQRRGRGGETAGEFKERSNAYLEENDLLFHFAETDAMAREAGRSAGSGPNANQRQNAQDFSTFFGEGFAEGVSSGVSYGEQIQLVLKDILDAITGGSSAISSSSNAARAGVEKQSYRGIEDFIRSTQNAVGELRTLTAEELKEIQADVLTGNNSTQGIAEKYFGSGIGMGRTGQSFIRYLGEQRFQGRRDLEDINTQEATRLREAQAPARQAEQAVRSTYGVAGRPLSLLGNRDSKKNPMTLNLTVQNNTEIGDTEVKAIKKRSIELDQQDRNHNVSQQL